LRKLGEEEFDELKSSEDESGVVSRREDRSEEGGERDALKSAIFF